MRTEQLEYVAAVARLGSFRRAAEDLHLSQPALSETVRNLERELGVELFERGRSGATLSADGRDLLAHVSGVIDAVDGLRRAAGANHQVSRMVRVATVNAGTVPVLTAAIAAFRTAHPTTQVEVVGLQEEQIHRGLRAGSLDLGLVTCLESDDPPPGFETTVLLSGRAVVCLRPDDPLALRDAIPTAELLGAPLIVMRAGYLMHRYLHRLLAAHELAPAYSTDGGEMGKLMVAEGLGVTLLPEFSVLDDPLERAGLITCRPLADDLHRRVRLVLRRRPLGAAGRSAEDLHRRFIVQADAWTRGSGGRRSIAGFSPTGART